MGCCCIGCGWAVFWKGTEAAASLLRLRCRTQKNAMRPRIRTPPTEMPAAIPSIAVRERPWEEELSIVVDAKVLPEELVLVALAVLAATCSTVAPYPKGSVVSEASVLPIAVT